MMRQKTDNLDRQLSYRLKKALGDDGRADWLEVCERAGMTRTLWHWSRRRVLLVAGVLVLAVGAAGASTGIIPWLGEAAKPVPPTIYPICKANDVQAKLTLHQSAGSRELSGSIALINTGDKLCALEGQPKLSLTGSGADSARLEVEMFSPMAGRSGSAESVFGSASRGQTLLGRSYEPPDKSAVSFGWQNWCGRDSTGLALRLQIPNGSDFTLAVTKLPGCVDSAKPSRLVLERANGAPPPLGPDFPLQPKIFSAKDGEPLVAEQGKVLHYRVALTNTSTTPYRFGDDCPMYDEIVRGSGRSVAGRQYVLNCHSVGVVEPGETVIFAMELPVPNETLEISAKGELYWGFTSQPLQTAPFTKAPIMVKGYPPEHWPSDVYSIFAPGTQNVTFPPKIEEAVQAATSGEAIVPGSRRALLKKDEPGGPVYAWVTVTGKLCSFFHDVAGCHASEQYMEPLFVDLEGYDSRGNSEIGGFAQDRVKQVDVVVSGEPIPVKVEDNTFYAEFTGGENVTAVIATLSDGSKVRVRLHSAGLAGTIPVG
jgi:hypothetical protein